MDECVVIYIYIYMLYKLKIRKQSALSVKKFQSRTSPDIELPRTLADYTFKS